MMNDEYVTNIIALASLTLIYVMINTFLYMKENECYKCPAFYHKSTNPLF